MATATPEGIASSIEAHATKLDPAILSLAGAQAAVMGPDDRNPLIEVRISSLISAMQAMDHSGIFKPDETGKAIVEQITPIVKDQEMLRQFCVAICTTLDRDSKAEEDSLVRSVGNIIEPIRQELTSVRNGLSTCAASVRKLPVPNKDQASTFRVSGVTGITAAEAHTKWVQKRQQVAKSWKVMKTS